MGERAKWVQHCSCEMGEQARWTVYIRGPARLIFFTTAEKTKKMKYPLGLGMQAGLQGAIAPTTLCSPFFCLIYFV